MLLDCGSLPNSKLFDSAWGKQTAQRDIPAIEFVGGLLVDSRNNTFLIGYTPTGMIQGDKAVSGQTAVIANGLKMTADAFLRKLSRDWQLTSYVLQIDNDRVDMAVALRTTNSKGAYFFGYPLDSGCLEPTASVLNDGQPSLRGVVLIEEPIETDTSYEGLSATDLALLLERGRRIPIKKVFLRNGADALSESALSPQLVKMAVREIGITKSIPIVAMHSGLIKRLHRDQAHSYRLRS